MGERERLSQTVPPPGIDGRWWVYRTFADVSPGYVGITWVHRWMVRINPPIHYVGRCEGGTKTKFALRVLDGPRCVQILTDARYSSVVLSAAPVVEQCHVSSSSWSPSACSSKVFILSASFISGRDKNITEG